MDALWHEGCRELLITGRGQFQARLTQIGLHEQRLLASEEQLSRIAFFAMPPDTVLISFMLSGGAEPVWGGVSIPHAEIVALGPGESAHMRSDGPCDWGAVLLPSEAVTRYASVLTGAGSRLPLYERRWRPRPSAHKHLRHLHAAAIRMARIRPQAVIDTEAAHGLEQQLIHAVIDCLAAGPMGGARPSTRRHQETMVRFEQLLQSRPNRRLVVAEFSAALGISERLLRRLCAEHLGMSPTSYDRRRRMSLVRSTLRSERFRSVCG